MWPADLLGTTLDRARGGRLGARYGVGCRLQPSLAGSRRKRARAGRVSWPTLLDRDGIELERHYRSILTELGTLGQIFRKATNHIQNPSRLKQLIVDLIDKET